VGQPEESGVFGSGRKDYVIRVLDFRSDTLASSPDDFQPFETLSMVLVDSDFDGNVFDLDLVFWADDLVDAALKRSELKSYELGFAAFLRKGTSLVHYMDVLTQEAHCD